MPTIKDNSVLDLAYKAIAHAQLDEQSRAKVDRHSLKPPPGVTKPSEAQAHNHREMAEAVKVLRSDGYDVEWRKAQGPTGIHQLQIAWKPGDGLPVNARSVGDKLLASSDNPVVQKAADAIGHARLNQSYETQIGVHSLKGSMGDHDSAAVSAHNLAEVSAAVSALKKAGYTVKWSKAEGPTGIHELTVGWWREKRG
jgi:hypothetical protein